MPDAPERLELLFVEAAARSGTARAAFLDHACGEDSALRQEVESLIASEQVAEGFLALAAAGLETSAERPERHFGPYRAVRRIGEGATSCVYLAVRADGELARRVAVKILRTGLDSEELKQRLRVERQILASLDHPNLVRLLDAGTTADSVPYFIMEYVEGLPIDLYCDQNRLDVGERLTLLAPLCAAVHYAHQHGVLHRDIKPSNVLVTADGIPKLLDFGIAKLLNPDLAMPGTPPTETWSRMLTPFYASPEQVRGQAVTTATDVYALGVLLFELLTGRLPYEFESRDLRAIDRVLRTRQPAVPSVAIKECAPDACQARASNPQALSRRLRGDLDAIVLRALRKEPRHRYRSAAHLAADLRRHRDGLPVHARRGALRYRAGRWLTRRWLALAVFAVATAGWMVSARPRPVVDEPIAGLTADSAGTVAGRSPAAGSRQRWCVPDGGLDDTLDRTECCSGFAVPGSTVCLDGSDWGTSWRSCNQLCGSRPIDSCIPSHGIDDTLERTRCCSGRAVPGSTRCLDPVDYGTTWRTCVQTCA